MTEEELLQYINRMVEQEEKIVRLNLTTVCAIFEVIAFVVLVGVLL